MTSTDNVHRVCPFLISPYIWTMLFIIRIIIIAPIKHAHTSCSHHEVNKSCEEHMQHAAFGIGQ